MNIRTRSVERDMHRRMRRTHLRSRGVEEGRDVEFELLREGRRLRLRHK